MGVEVCLHINHLFFLIPYGLEANKANRCWSDLCTVAEGDERAVAGKESCRRLVGDAPVLPRLPRLGFRPCSHTRNAGRDVQYRVLHYRGNRNDDGLQLSICRNFRALGQGIWLPEGGNGGTSVETLYRTG